MQFLYLKRFLPRTITKRLYLQAFVIVFFPLLIIFTFQAYQLYTAYKNETTGKIYAVADLLYHHVISQGMEKKAVKQIQPFVNQISQTYKDIGMGYYSAELSYIVAMYPFEAKKLVRVSYTDFPYFTIYETGKAKFGESNTLTGLKGIPVLYYAIPIKDNQVVVGHVWANAKMEDIYQRVYYPMLMLLIGLTLIGVVVMALVKLIIKSVDSDLKEFSQFVVTNELTLSEGIPQLNPVLQEISLLQDRFQKAFQLSPDIMTFQDTANNRYIEVNESWVKAFGWTAHEAIGKTPEDLGIINAESRLFSKNGIDNEEVVLRNKKGEEVILLHSVYNLILGGKKISLSSAKDVTQLKKIEREISRLGKLELIGQMAAGISHEIRNPMTTVRGFLQILSQKEEYKKDIEYFDLMIEELDRANGIITEYLSLAQNKNIDLKAHNINTILQKLYPLLAADALEHDINIEYKLNEIPDLLIDEKEIRQLILNLIHNGLEAAQLGSRIIIKTCVENDQVVFSIKDEGSGIPEEIIDRLGTPFLTTKDKGTGLGLSICYSIAHRHKATIDVESTPKGTTFYVKFKIP